MIRLYFWRNICLDFYRGREGSVMREQRPNWLPPTRPRLGMGTRPHREWELQTFRARDGAPPTMPQQPGWDALYFQSESLAIWSNKLFLKVFQRLGFHGIFRTLVPVGSAHGRKSQDCPMQAEGAGSDDIKSLACNCTGHIGDLGLKNYSDSQHEVFIPTEKTRDLCQSLCISSI